MTYVSAQRATKRLKLPMGCVTFGSLCIKMLYYCVQFCNVYYQIIIEEEGRYKFGNECKSLTIIAFLRTVSEQGAISVKSLYLP
jgi:hypothetical protein